MTKESINSLDRGRAILPGGLIAVLFFVAMLPLAATRVIDTMNFERYYTDAAASMVQTHDYLTPRQGDGAIRLHKPMLTYWLLALSYKLCGVSFLSSRLPFVLVGCAAIALTYQMTLMLGGGNRGASTAALILGSNLLFICVAIRAIQDVLLTFALLLSAYGFIRLICLNKADALAHWTAYGGAALGVAVKGSLPLVFLGYAFAFAYFAGGLDRPFRRLFNLPAMVVSAAVACLPSALLAWKHGTREVWHSFWSDQVGDKVSLAGSFPRIAGYLLVYLVCFAPWLIAVGLLLRRNALSITATPSQRQACRFIIIWALLLAVLFGLGDRVHNRYLVPAIPLVAVAFALMFNRATDDDVQRATRPLLDFALVVGLLLALFGLVVLQQNGLLATHLAGALIAGLTGLIIALRLFHRRTIAPTALALSILVLLLLCLAILGPFTLPDQTTQVARALRALQFNKSAPVLVGNDKLRSRLRMATENQYDIRRATKSELLRDTNAIYVLTEGEARTVSRGAFVLRPVATYPKRLAVASFMRSVMSGESKAYVNRYKVHCYLATVAPVDVR